MGQTKFSKFWDALKYFYLSLLIASQHRLFCHDNEWQKDFDASQLVLQRTETAWHMIKT
jgi:hypothetical protein